jgi:thiol-disulfide isomerase/thioredoxin
MDRALSAARSSDRYLLINFTGSNWCGWCIRLDREVFGHPHFRQEAGRDLVLVALDFPRPSNQSEEVRRRNAEWRDRLGVRGFPTVYLADAEGRPFARTGYRPGGVVRYLEHLRELIGLRRGQEQLVARAMRTEGLDRARLLGQALAVPGIMTPEQDEILDLIREADPEDSLGLIARFGGDEGEDEEDAAGDDAEGGEEAEAPKTPLQRDLEAVRAMIESGELDGVARALRDVQRTYRPEGAELADWALVRIDFLVALERPGPAVRQASRTMRVRGMPGEAAQRLGHRKALILLGMGRGEAALKAWDEAIGLAESELATEMREGRAEFAARCREAS